MASDGLTSQPSEAVVRGVDFAALIGEQILQRNAAELRPVECVFSAHRMMQNQLFRSQQRLQETREENARLEERSRGLGQQVRTLELSAAGVLSRTDREEELEARVAELQRRLEENLTQEKDYYKAICDARRLGDENANLREEVTRLTEQSSQREGVLRMLKNEYVALKQENDVVRPKLGALTTERDRLLRELLAAKDAVAKLHERILEHEDTINRLRKASRSTQQPQQQQQKQWTPSQASSSHTEALDSSGPASPFQPSRQPVATRQEVRPEDDVRPPSAVAFAVDGAHGDRVLYGVCAADGGQRLLTGGGDKTIRHWDLASGSPLRSHASADVALCVDSKSHYLLAGCADGVTRFWDMRSLRTVELTGHSEKVVAAYLSQSAHSAFTASSDRTVKLWDVRSSAMVRTIMCPSSCNDLCVADALIFSAHYNGSIWLWDRRSAGPGNEIKRAHQQGVTCVRLDACGQQCVSLGRDGAVSVRDVRSMDRELLRVEHEDLRISTNLARLALSPDGRLVAVGNTAGDVLLVKLSQDKDGGVLPQRLSGGHSKAVHNVVWTLNGTKSVIVSVGEDKRIVAWR